MNLLESISNSTVVSNILSYISFRVISSIFLTLLFLSSVGAIPLLDRRFLGFFGFSSLIISIMTNPIQRDYTKLLNEFLVGFFVASSAQLIFLPLTAVREFDFAIIVLGGVSSLGMLFNRNSKFAGTMAKITIFSGTSLIVLNIFGGFFVNPNYSTNSWIVAFFIIISGFLGLRFFGSHDGHLSFYIPTALGFVFAIWHLIILTQQSDYGGAEGDFGYRYNIGWAGLHILYSLVFATILYAHNRKSTDSRTLPQAMNKIIDSKYSIPAVSAIATVIFFFPGLDDSFEPKRHVDWHMGLYSILAQNLLDFGLLNPCGGEVLLEGNISAKYPGCWVYPTYWFNPLIWPLAVFMKIGLNPIFSSRLIVLICQFLILLLVGRNIEIWFGRGTGTLGVIALVSSMQFNFYGEILAPQLAVLIWCLIMMYGWSQIFKGEKMITDKPTIWVFSLLGPLAMGASATIFAMAFFAVSYLCFNEFRCIIAKGFAAMTAAGIASWFIWRSVIDYYWDSMGGSQENLIEKARYRSQSIDYLSSADFYLTTVERAGWILNVVLVTGLFLLLFHILSKENFRKNMNDFSKRLFFICTPFFLLQIQEMVMFPQSINQHDYLNLFWLAIPCSVAFASLTKPNFSTLTLCFLFLSATIVATDLEKMGSRHEGSNNPHLYQIQDWLYQNLEGYETILMTDDLYENNLITALSSNNVLVRPVNDSSNFQEDWLSDSLFDVVVVNSESISHWRLFQNNDFIYNWCLVQNGTFDARMAYHINYSFHIYKQC